MQQSGLADSGAQVSVEEIRDNLRRFQRQEWWMLASALGSIALLIMALLALSLSRGPGSNLFSWIESDDAVRGLFVLILLFNALVLYHQRTVKRLRADLTGKLDSLEARSEMLHKLVVVDPLTELYNRRFATEHLPKEIDRSERQVYPLTALMLDLNDLKGINDRYGHVAGDLAIKEFARHIRKAFRSSDLPVRIGGDEFLVLLPECQADAVPRVLTHLSNIEIECNGQRIPVTFSAGWAQHRPGEGATELLERADRELYLDKGTRATQEQVRRAEAQIRQDKKLQTVGELAGGVAHDFNNLLTVIRGYAELLAERLGPDNPLRETAREIDKAADRAAALTHQLLSFSRPQVLQARILDLNQVLSSLEMMLKSLVGARIRVEMQLSDALGRVRCDSGQLQQVILNLVLNARDAMAGTGTILIQTGNGELDDDYVRNHPGARAGAYVFLKVSDSGCGIPLEVRKRIFEPFFTTKEKGTGLGLSIVYGIVKQTGSYIWVDSEVGQGTVFTVYFPRVKEPADAIPEMSGAQQASLPLGGVQ